MQCIEFYVSHKELDVLSSMQCIEFSMFLFYLPENSMQCIKFFVSHKEHYIEFSVFLFYLSKNSM